MKDCIFCAIVAWEAEASRVAENDLCLAFLTIGPFNTGHTLVVPKRHAATFTDLTPQEAGALAELGQQVARAIQASGLPCDGLNLWMANGEVAGQDVFHAHLHVIPRASGDRLNMQVQWTHPPRAVLDGVAGELRAAMEQGSR
ncbi:HIT family protein [Deinococcus metallilatus]|uniref:Diadenosine tetraphosphate (Ap4A) HIT family hydrolase n=1 Tax=Deinococcus metallilatus TaxID=1211322 RepID=A0AAJ5F6I5_9DEIO|nr:HIT family protein [Deinococcus metallilatus]MBB5294608.1 diadenosine tetraphosphate (Ap4A) HIT family hydrolase [Deinococcus metallilatus]QBY07647.1 HIT family protein [Deinococcus metallilatus]RXJ14063.1 HIT family protein [Deinococcus metallilatus]TLK30028.1 HIT family protein [Deinococcus metallilatus]GMA15821.1 hypothetical histidine triad protein [Deinococcus metallilatus]